MGTQCNCFLSCRSAFFFFLHTQQVSQLKLRVAKRSFPLYSLLHHHPIAHIMIFLVGLITFTGQADIRLLSNSPSFIIGPVVFAASLYFYQLISCCQTLKRNFKIKHPYIFYQNQIRHVANLAHPSQKLCSLIRVPPSGQLL